MDLLETLTEKLLAHLPTELSFLASLMQRTEGQYIVLGFAIVIMLLVAWLLFAALQMIFVSAQRKTSTEKTSPIELSEKVDAENSEETENGKGFSFFKKEPDNAVIKKDEDSVLIAIEQEMLAVRQLYTDGHLIKEVYVSETLRLYNKARVLNDG